MCGRYYIAEDDMADELVRIIKEINRKKTPEGLKISGEIFPSDIVPVLANSRQQDVQPFAMRWGYSFPNSRPIINARCETASTKPMFNRFFVFGSGFWALVCFAWNLCDAWCF